MKKILFCVLNILYSILGWFLCIVQIGESMIVNYNQYLIPVLEVLQLSAGLFINLFSYSLMKKKDFEKAQNYKALLLIDCGIIILPYFLMILLWVLMVLG